MQKRRSDCPINFALELFGDRWTFLIVRDMMFKGKQYYKDFLLAEEKIATNILADRLARLEQEGIVVKITDSAHASRFIYKLTSKGVDLAPLMVEMILWSAKYDKNSAADIAFVKRATGDKAALLREIVEGLKEG